MLPDTILIQPPVFNALAAYGIAAIALVMAVACLGVYTYNDRRLLIMLIPITLIGMGGSATAALSGLLFRFDIFPPPMVIMMISVFVVSFAFGLSTYGRTIAMQTSLTALVGLQAFRLPLELVMHHAGNQSIMPIQLSYSGYNYDIVTGIGAIVLVVLMRTIDLPKLIVWVWNVWGMLCLLAITVIAVSTSPMVRAFGDDPRNINTWVLFFPYVWLPVVLVTIAISGHIIITRKLLARAAQT